MPPKRRRPVSHDEQQILEECEVRLLSTPAEIRRCDQLIRQHHYLHDATLVGEHLRYGMFHRGQWRAVASWSAAAFHLKDRDAYIGWTPDQCRRRRALVANNARLLVLPEVSCPNLISRFLRLMLERLAPDWQQRWGHPLALVESFVDPRYFQGTAYKASGWTRLGPTAGWHREASDFYQKHEAPKQLWVRPLERRACRRLRAEELPPEWAGVEASVPPRATASKQQILSLRELVRGHIAEFRRVQARAYPIEGMVCLIVMAAVQGVVRGPEDLADYAQTLSQAQLRSLGFHQQPDSRRYRAPGKTTFGRVLEAVDSQALERLILRWQAQLLGQAQDALVILEGKALRHGGVQIVHAVDSQGRFLGSVLTDAKSNEIPAARQLLRRLEVQGKLVLADALHTQQETAQQILYELGGDYLLTVKANQKTVHQTLESLFQRTAFSPSADAAYPRPEARA